mmetsp:Transcript_13080/g.11851  ORF Transcript_13080/g.11851 Transcript_13080/m.11851 type:complete len:481 (+) Transcript_13080:63-1505(+)
MSYITNQKAIENRRKQETKFKEMDAAITADKRIYQIASFEQTTSNKISRRIKQERYNQMKKDHDEELNNRRRQLADLYNYEMDNWRQQVLSKVETQEDRKQRIRERAYALRDARERERLQLVQSKYEQQWREANDDARTLDSQALTNYMSQQRLQQIEQKRLRKQQLNNDENIFLAEWKKQLDEMAEKDRLKRERLKQADLKTAEDLKEQMNYNTKRKQEHYLRNMEEDEREIAMIRQALKEEEEIINKKREEERLRGKEILEFNEQYKELIKLEDEIDKQNDAILLDYALKKEKQIIESEELKKLAHKESALQYKQYLQEQMKKEAIDTAYIDEIRRIEEEKVWIARDNALQQRENARKYLMKEVDIGRQEQIKQRQIELLNDKEEGKKFADKFIKDAKLNIEIEKMNIEKNKLIAIDNSNRLKQQINERYQQSQLSKQEIYLQDKHMQYMEKLHQQKLKEQGATLRLNHPLKTGQWYT